MWHILLTVMHLVSELCLQVLLENGLGGHGGCGHLEGRGCHRLGLLADSLVLNCGNFASWSETGGEELLSGEGFKCGGVI